MGLVFITRISYNGGCMTMVWQGKNGQSRATRPHLKYVISWGFGSSFYSICDFVQKSTYSTSKDGDRQILLFKTTTETHITSSAR